MSNALSLLFAHFLHRILKTGTKDSYFAWFGVGEYKKRADVVDGIEAVAPSEVAQKMKDLLLSYNSKTEIKIEDIVEFHYNFELIHPFRDSDGKVGRLICFKECLRHIIIPFIIEDSKKLSYYLSLCEWENEKVNLIETCLNGQDTYKALLRYFGIVE